MDMDKNSNTKKYTYTFLVFQSIILLMLVFVGGWYGGSLKTRDKTIREILGKTTAVNVDGIVTGVAKDQKSVTVDVPLYAGVVMPVEYRLKTVTIEKAELARISRKTEPVSQSAAEKKNAPITIPFNITPADASSLAPGVKISMTFSGGALASLLSPTLAPVKITILDTQ